MLCSSVFVFDGAHNSGWCDFSGMSGSRCFLGGGAAVGWRVLASRVGALRGA